MIIIDTNVWVSFFKGEKKAQLVKDLIIGHHIVMHPYIYGELLLGGISEKTGQLILALDTVKIIDEKIVYRFIKENKLASKGVGWVDVNLLAAALSENHHIHTFDDNLLKVCREFNCHVY